ALAYLSHPRGDRLGEHRPGKGEGMELPAFAARVDVWRHARDKVAVEQASCPLARRLARVDAGKPRAQAAGDHFLGERACRQPPERKQRLDAERCKLPLAIAPDIVEEQ